MAIKQLYGDRDLNGDILKNHTFTVFADLAAATAVVGTVFGFAYIADVGSLYYNQTGLSWQPVGSKGSKGDVGAAGPAGADGNTVLSGVGAPGAGLGVDGDFYINAAASTIYGPKTAGAWGSPTSLVGASGNTVLNGIGAPGAVGVPGDFYIDTAADAIYGPKVGLSWGTATSLYGPAGVAGPPGPPGAPGETGPAGESSGTDAAYGTVASHTTTGIIPPVAPPVILTPPRYYFDTVALQMYKWDGTVWGATTVNYIDLGNQKLYVQSPGEANGWAFGTNLGASPVLEPIVSASGQVTASALATIIPVNSSGGPVTITLQTTPSAGQLVEVKDSAGAAEANPITVVAQGLTKLNGVTTGSVVLDRAYSYHRLLFATFDTNPVTSPVPGWWTVSGSTAIVAAVTISGATALDNKRDQTILYDATAGAFAITLPAAPREGDVVRFKEKMGLTTAVTITGTVDGAVNPVLNTARQLYIAEYLGGAWRKLN